MSDWIPLWLHRLSSPPTFYRFAGALQPWAMGLALLLGAVALYGGLVLAPADYQQGDAYRIIFIHVPSAWMSMFIYAVMGVASFVALVWRIKLAEVVAMESAPIAAAFLAIIGIINVPIVHFSVNWWNTLHQGSTVNLFGHSKMAWDMLWPLLVLTLATKFYYVASLFRRARTDLLDLESGRSEEHTSE